MAIDKTSRKETVVQVGSGTDVAFAVPFEIENTTDLAVYDASGALAREGIDYAVTNYGLPAVTANAITVTWIGTTDAGTYTFYRNFPTTQTAGLSTEGTKNGLVEVGFDRLSLAVQNSTLVSDNVVSTDGDGITLVGEPAEDTDASTVRYAQEVYSQTGDICPPVRNTDNDKALYAQSTTSFIWKDPFDVPYPTANTKVLQVSGLGVPAWVDPVEYAPVFPTDEPKYLGVTSEASAWTTVSQLPALSKGTVGDTLTYQEGGHVAWEFIRWLPLPPNQHKFLYNSTGTGVDGAVSSTTLVSFAADKVVELKEASPDENRGADSKPRLRNETGDRRIPMMEFDCSSLVASDFSYDNIVSCNLKIYFTVVSGSTNDTHVIRRVKNTFTEGTGAAGNSYNDDGATWEKPTAPGGTPDWNWGGGDFDPLAELDYEQPATSFLLGVGTGTDTVAGQSNYFDVTALLLDALQNRSGILRLCIYAPDTDSNVTSSRFWSNTGNANDVKLEITTATDRTTYWQKWNYMQHSPDMSAGYVVAENCRHMYPHVKQRTTAIATDKGGHISNGGAVAACSYGASREGQPITLANDAKGHVAVSADGNTMHNFVSTVVGGVTGSADIPLQLQARISQIWMEHE
jgi:hypothetical protein